jgi:hypothetical protein
MVETLNNLSFLLSNWFINKAARGCSIACFVSYCCPFSLLDQVKVKQQEKVFDSRILGAERKKKKVEQTMHCLICYAAAYYYASPESSR